MKKNETYHESASRDISQGKLRCIFVHGWGMNSALWQPLIESLPDWLVPMTPDLPGHGLRTAESFDSLDELASDLGRLTDEPALWVGWSLGGLAVTRLALVEPQKVAAMLLVSSSPCFVKRPDWPAGMDAGIFDMFASDLEQDFPATLQRFLSLQVRGSESGRQLLRQLRKKVLALPSANIDALRAGLQLLKTADLRAELHTLHSPAKWVLGERDTLVDVALATVLPELMPAASVHTLRHAGHAPFLSHLAEFREQLISFASQVHESVCD